MGERFSLEELIKTGCSLGPIYLGMRRKALFAIAGEPPLWGTEHSMWLASIWRYEEIEFHFVDDFLCFIFSDCGALTQGGPSLHIEPWWIRQGLARNILERGLTQAGIAFVQQPQKIVTDSGFTLGLEEVSGPRGQRHTGLAWWSTRMA